MTSPSSSPSSPSSPAAPPPDPLILLLLLKTPSPNPTSDKYTLTLSSPPTRAPLHIPVLSHTLRPDPLINLLLTHLPSSSTPTPPPPPFPYGALILTSQRSAAALNAALASPAVRAKCNSASLSGSLGKVFAPGGLVIYTVGPATASAVRDVCSNHGLSNIVDIRGGGGAGSGEVLARGMLGGGAGLLSYNIFENENENEQECRGQQQQQQEDADAEPAAQDTKTTTKKTRKKPILFLAGETRRDIIPRLLQSADLSAEEHIHVDEMTVYASTELEGFAFEYAGALARTEGLAGKRWTVVFSPMAGRGMLKGLGWLDEGTGKVDEGKMAGRRDYICCIGPTTRAYLSREFGLEADVVAEKPSPEGVREGIGRFMASHSWM